MTTVAESSELPGAKIEDGDPQPAATADKHTTNMEAIKVEDAIEPADSAVISSDKKTVAPTSGIDVDGDSEAETLIVSPEKKKAIAEGNVHSDEVIKQANIKDDTNTTDGAPGSSKKTRKRKRELDGEYEASSKASSPQSSPLSSPAIPAQSRDSDSDASNTSAPRSAKIQRSRRAVVTKADSEIVDGNAMSKAKRRRPSDIIPPMIKHRSKGSVDAGAPERRETRSATYPRHSSEERSPSPRPSSRREHRRGLSTQLTSAEFERKKRGRPPLINTRRNKSADRADSSSDESSTPSLSRPTLHKFSSHDHDTMSPAKATGPRKWRDKNGRTFLSRACNNDDLAKAKICFQERPEDLNLPDNAGNSPLQIAALEGFIDIVKFLLEKGADVDTRNIDKETPLIDALENGHLEVVKLLLSHGANPRLGNAKGDEPYELVPQDDPNYKTIRKLIADAKDNDFTKRRRSADNKKDDSKDDGERGSSRAPSAASPRDSPPITGPRSPPTATSRRRTGRSESTRNDLLWQANTPENLRLLAAKGNVQGVIYVLNILQKAEPEAVIAAAKAGHEEVLQYLLAMGDADPDPDPVPDLKAGFNTPMLAAIGRGHLDVVKLLVEQTGFNPTRRWRNKTYFEISADRKGENWQKEHDILKTAHEKHVSGKSRKTTSPRKTRDQDRPREKKIPRSTSPVSSNLRHSSSPSVTHKSLPEKSPKSVLKDRKREAASPQQQERRKPSVTASLKDLPDTVAVASDQEHTVADKKGHKHRRSQSDLPLPPDLDTDVAHRRRRLVTGKEHRRRKSGAVDHPSREGSEIEGDSKHERDTATPGLKRTRSSVSPDPKRANDADSDRISVKKRRTVPESSPEDSRPQSKKQPSAKVEQDTEMKDAGAMEISDASSQAVKVPESLGETISKDVPAPENPHVSAREEGTPKPQTPLKDVTPSPKSGKPPAETERPALDLAAEAAKEAAREAAEVERQKREEEEKKAEEARRAEEERVAAEKAAAERAIAEREAAEKAAHEKRLAEEAAKRKAEEEAMARKREEEERQERIRRELEETKRRQEEQIRQQRLEIERRRREALPAGLAKASHLLETEDPSYSQWLTRFLPLFTVRTEQFEPNCSPSVAQDLWVPNWQVAVLLGTKDLNLRNYTSFDKRDVTLDHRDRMWRVGRFMLSYDFWTNGYNTPVKMANEIERRERPKFWSMAELSWVKVSLSRRADIRKLLTLDTAL
jgi:ankyrin repeat protein